MTKETESGAVEVAPDPVNRDLSRFNVVKAAERGLTHEIIGLDNKPTGIIVHLLGFDAPKVIQAGRDFEKWLADYPQPDTHIDDINMARRGNLVAAAVTDWAGLILDGQKVTSANARELMSSVAWSWIANAIYTKGASRANLFRSGSES